MPCRIATCVAQQIDGSEYCAVHKKYREVGADVRCAKCTKKIRGGSVALINDSTGSLEHQVCRDPKK